jgi:hypothetical protein
MKAEHTPEQLALARKIAAYHYARKDILDEAGQKKVLAGEFDHWSQVQVALAAIVETTERMKAMLDRCKEPCPDCWDAIERGDHLKDPSHADG